MLVFKYGSFCKCLQIVRVMVFYATFNNISVLSWRSVLLVEETGVPGENHRPAQVTDTFYQIMLYRMHIDLAGFELTMLVVIGTDCIDNYKFNYHTITTTTSPFANRKKRHSSKDGSTLLKMCFYNKRKQYKFSYYFIYLSNVSNNSLFLFSKYRTICFSVTTSVHISFIGLKGFSISKWNISTNYFKVQHTTQISKDDNIHL